MLPLLLLASAPVASYSSSESGEDPLKALYYLIGSQIFLSIIAMAVGVVRWMASRTVEREDKDKESLAKRIDAHETRFKEVEEKHAKKLEELEETQDERVKEIEDALHEMERSVNGVVSDVKSVRETLESIRGGVAELRTGLDSRFEKQAEFYRATSREYTTGVEKKLEDLEYKLRQDMTRAVADVMRQKSRGGKS